MSNRVPHEPVCRVRKEKARGQAIPLRSGPKLRSFGFMSNEARPEELLPHLCSRNSAIMCRYHDYVQTLMIVFSVSVVVGGQCYDFWGEQIMLGTLALPHRKTALFPALAKK
jgi:hypothetical protein